MVPIFSRLGFSRGWRGWWCHPNYSNLMEEKGMGTFCHQQSMRWSVSWSSSGSQPPPTPFCCSFLWRNGSLLGGSWSTSMCVRLNLHSSVSPTPLYLYEAKIKGTPQNIWQLCLYLYNQSWSKYITRITALDITLENLKCYAPSLIRSDTTEIMRSNAVSVYRFMKEQDNNKWTIMIALDMMTITEWDSWRIPYGQAGSCQGLHLRGRPK